MFKLGEVSIKAEKLIKTTYESMMKAIDIVKEGVHLGDIGFTIQNHVEAQGFSVVQDFVATELVKHFIKNLMCYIMEKKALEKKLKQE